LPWSWGTEDEVARCLVGSLIYGGAVHVCLVVESHPFANMGGAEYQAHLLAMEFSRRAGVRTTYLSRFVPAEAEIPYDVRQMGQPTVRGRRAALLDAQRLWTSLRELQPDVIYQRIKQSYTAVCALYARHSGIPLFFHAASEQDVDTSWRQRRWSMNTPLDFAEVAAGNWGVRHASHVIVQTHEQAILLRANMQRGASLVVRNFQPLPVQQQRIDHPGVCVVWVGNLKPVKRPHLYVELAHRLQVHPEIQFLMVGRPGAERGMPQLMSEIAATPNIKFLGELTLDEVNALMDRADILVNTSNFEGSPNTFIQAWAHGVVVTSLAVDVDGGMETQGIGFCRRDMAQLAQIIAELARSPDWRRSVAERAFSYVHREHSLDNAMRLADTMLSTAQRAVDRHR